MSALPVGADGRRLLEDRTVMVTGAGGGVGRGIALACASNGANVIIAARRLETGDAVAREIAEAGGRALSLRCDVSVRADVEAAVAAAIEHFGGLDSIIHNALSFVGEPHEIQDVPEETWRSMVETGLRATYYCAQAAFAELQERKGTLILLTSAAGIEGSPYIPAYGVVKAGQRGLAKSLAREWGPLGIRVNCIGPVAWSPAMERSAELNPVFFEGRLMDRTPLRRIGQPEADIGPVAVFLASDMSRYMTGQVLIVDGGGFTPN
jgi:NAD(P)-dependent dehydrogenase (short-subunit alcohol dehydrogenase family)